MSDLVNGSIAATRAADTLLRAAGGRSVILRTPAPAVAGDITEQLGIATPSFQDSTLAPVVLRRAKTAGTSMKPARWELLVSATVVEQLVGSLDGASASILFASAFGVFIDGDLFEIVSATADELFGQPYVYRLVLQEPLVRLT